MSTHGRARTTYTLVFVALMILLALSVIAAQFDLGDFNLVTALGISVAKAALIVTFFMHVGETLPITRLAALGGLLWLSIMVTLTLADYWTRGPGPALWSRRVDAVDRAGPGQMRELGGPPAPR